MTKTILLFVALFAMTLPSSASTRRRIPKQRRSHSVSSSSRKAPRSKRIKSRAPKYKAPKYKAPKIRRSYQQSPTAERYKDIQQAMASKGYFRGEPNGEWGTDSEEALKRFQADQSLRPDGKITSLSLIALGLGPKRLTAQSQTPPQ